MEDHGLVRPLGVNDGRLMLLLRKNTGADPIGRVNQVRVAWAKDLLLVTPVMVKVAAFVLRFQDQSHLSRVFKRFEGISPRESRPTTRPPRGTRGTTA